MTNPARAISASIPGRNRIIESVKPDSKAGFGSDLIDFRRRGTAAKASKKLKQKGPNDKESSSGRRSDRRTNERFVRCHDPRGSFDREAGYLVADGKGGKG
jgi:hypothetical protein